MVGMELKSGCKDTTTPAIPLLIASGGQYVGSSLGSESDDPSSLVCGCCGCG